MLQHSNTKSFNNNKMAVMGKTKTQSIKMESALRLVLFLIFYKKVKNVYNLSEFEKILF